MIWINSLLILGALVCHVACSRQELVTDVLEGRDVTLQCRISNPSLMGSGQIYWRMQRNGQDKDLVALGKTKYHNVYQPFLDEATGSYDLLIPHAMYDRDNGVFECLLKEHNTGTVLHTTTFNLTVLIPPSTPRITPDAPTATEGQPIDLTCSSTGGSPDPQIIWYRKGINQNLKSLLRPGGGKDFPTTSVITIHPQKEDDGAEYRCDVWNRALADGDKMVASVTLNVNYYPRITIGPRNPMRVEIDQPVEMTCSADAKPAVSNVRWNRNGKFIGILNTLRIKRVDLNDAGPYVCEANNDLDKPADAELTLYVLYGPRVSVTQSKDVQEGEDIEIICNVTADPPPITIEWLKDGDESFRQIGNKLQLKRVTARNQGNYICRAVNFLNPTNGDGGERIGNDTVAVRIRHAPGKTYITPSEPIAVQDERTVLTCSADPPGWPMPSYKWWRKDNPDVNVKLGANYTIARASPSDEGTYVCQPSNTLGKGTEAAVTVKVYQAPTILESLKPSNILKIGSTGVNLVCRAQGSPQPSIVWKKDGVVLNSSDGYYNIIVEQSTLGSNAGYTVKSTLEFRGNRRIKDNQLIPQDRGYYECVFKNEVREVSSAQQLIVQHAPITVHKENKVAFDLSEDAQLECRMQAHPKPKFDWLSTRSFIIPGSRYHTNTTEQENDIFASVLTIRGVIESDYGDYTCKGENNMGHHKTIIKLQPKSKPEKPTQLQIVQSGTDFIELAWEDGFNGGFSNTKFSVRAKSATGSLDFDCQTNNPCVIDKLKQQTSYTLNVGAYNEKGNSELSEDIHGSTSVDVDSIPAAEDVYFEEIGRKLSFSKVSTSLVLEGHVEILHRDSNDWMAVPDPITMKDSYGEMELGDDDPEAIRVRFCSEGSTTLCGPYMEAHRVKQLSNRAPSRLGMEYMIAIILGCVLFPALIILVLICCCCRRRNNKLKNKAAEMDVSHRGVVTQQVPPPPYYTVGLDNKAMNGSLENGLNDHGKTSIYGTQQYHDPNQDVYMPKVPDNNGFSYLDNSHSNSNNSGSVNSQDSLWQVKAQGKYPGNNRVPQTDSHGYQYDPMLHGGYGITGYDDYSQYPPTHSPHQQGQGLMNEEYPNPRMNYGANGDPYAAVQKPRKRMDHIDGSYDVSGIPDPYMDHHDPNMQGIPDISQDNKPQISFDESLESGYSTPNSRNRRIIREIIV